MLGARRAPQASAHDAPAVRRRYGAFMAANLLAHAGDLFACGIARRRARPAQSASLHAPRARQARGRVSASVERGRTCGWQSRSPR